jgi:serine phosphatase RsbU (regulator of sigma subunit)
MPAALVMANLQANLRSQCATALEYPEKMLRSVNDLFYNNTVEAIYASLFFAEYDDRTQRLRYANCGHLSALLLRGDDKIEQLCSTCTVLGLFKEWDCSINEIQLFRGDTLVLYTDGVTEARNAARQEFGEQRLIEGLRKCRKFPPRAMLASIIDEVAQFSAHERYDDVTLIVGTCIEPVS